MEPHQIVFSLMALFLGTSMVAWAVTYALWARVRLTFLRQNLFALRDRLWDDVRKIDGLQDPLYLQTRQQLNSAIRFAELLNIESLQLVAKHGNVEQRVAQMAKETPASIVPGVDALCAEAKATAFDTIMTYVLYRTGRGILFIVREICHSSFRSTRQSIEASLAWIFSSSPESVLRSGDSSGVKVGAHCH